MRSSFEEGDKPAVDTLEAQISLRVREAELLKAEQALENVRINIENYLWVEGFVPLEMDGNVRAEELIDDRFQVGINSIQLQSEQLIAKHPELLMYGFKVEGLGVDRRLAREELKPDLRLDYNPLVGLGTNSLVGTFNPADYMLGVSFNYPIVQRKQRGKLDLIDVKLKDTEIDLVLKNQLIRTKLRNFENNINQSIAQRVIFESMVFDYSRLLSAERRKFDIGESSIFLINSREIKYLESRYKSVEASTKVLSNQLKYMFVLGVMDEIVSVIN
jgi:outer membrane protein TolC